jgi:hypothetical protein
MEDELWSAFSAQICQEGKRRIRQKRLLFNDSIILLIALWAVLHDRPISWACRRCSWPKGPPWFNLPSPATMSRRLRSLSVQLLLEAIFYRLLAATSPLCLCRRIDSKPLPVGGCSKDHDARWGYATHGKYKGYKLFGCWGNGAVPEAVVMGPMNQSDQAGGIALVDQLQRLHAGAACGYLLADASHDTNPLHDHAGRHCLQLLTPRKRPGTDLGHRQHSPHRLRSIELLEGAACFGRELYRQRDQIERDLGHLGSFGGGLQPLPNFVRRPRRVTLWVILKLMINGLRICLNQGLRRR